MKKITMKKVKLLRTKFSELQDLLGTQMIHPSHFQDQLAKIASEVENTVIQDDSGKEKDIEKDKKK